MKIIVTDTRKRQTDGGIHGHTYKQTYTSTYMFGFGG